MPCQNNEKGCKTVLLKFEDGNGPYCVAFAYPKNGPYVIKGSEKNVSKYISKLKFCHYNFTLWTGTRKFLSEWRINDKKWKIVLNDSNGKRKFIFKSGRKIMLEMRRIPNKFITELSKVSVKPNLKEK
jgi:hypothetical protein